MPLSHPDMRLGRWFYFKQLQGGIFFDHAQGSQGPHSAIGAQLYTVFNMPRLPIAISGLGIEVGHRIEAKDWFFGPALRVDY